MRRKQERHGTSMSSSSADYAAGGVGVPLLNKTESSTGLESVVSTTSDIEFYEDLISDPVLVLGVDISHLSRTGQFIICASGVFFFSLLYGYLQELLSVKLCSRQLGLFLATVQFVGYTILAYVLRSYVYRKQNRVKPIPRASKPSALCSVAVPFKLYLGLSLLRALDLGMTNLAMQYINYPAKTLMKSSRVLFTMMFGVCITRKRYNVTDYVIALCMGCGLAIFMHADATSSAIFQPLGVVMLTVSLMCDGAITNMSESIMNQYNVGQDEFIFRMYSIALIAISVAAAFKGDFAEGIVWILQPGTYEEQQNNVPLEDRAWSSSQKITVVILFSSMGFFGSSCAAAITKQFGALTMSITSVSRKATTLFLSFLLFDNECTLQHIIGIIIFISALTAKSIRRKNKRRKPTIAGGDRTKKTSTMDLELGNGMSFGDRDGRLSRESSFTSDESYDTLESTSTFGSHINGNGNNGRRKSKSSSRSTMTERSPNGGRHRSRYHVV